MSDRVIFSPRRINADGTLNLANLTAVGTFLANTAGTLSLTINGVALLTAFPVTAGQSVPLNYAVGAGLPGTSELVLAGGASGSVGVV